MYQFKYEQNFKVLNITLYIEKASIRRSRYKERRVDALALRAEERRDKLR